MRLFVIVVACAICACASHPIRKGTVVAMQDIRDPKANNGVGPKGRYTCGMEKPTGSNQAQRVCRYDDDDADSARHRQMQQDAINQQALIGIPFKP